MSIDIRKYVAITSGVGAGASVRRRDLIARMMTQNAMVSPGKVLEFTSADAVGAIFGTDSEEYKRAAFVFGWISKLTTRNKKVSYARYAPAGAAPRIFGNTDVKDLTALKAITAGAVVLILGGVSVTVSGLNFGTATSLADVANLLQTAINADTNPNLTTATVAYDAVSRRFNFTGGQTQAVTMGVGTPLAGVPDASVLLGWKEADGAIITDGAAANDAVATLIDMNSRNNNYGSLFFIGTPLSDEDVIAVAQYNKTQNNNYMYCVAVTGSNAVSLMAAIGGIGGTTATLTKTAGQYAEMCPGIVLGATDYTRANASGNYMYQQFPGLETTVDSDADAATYDGMGVNYNGATQTAGQRVEFYQDGVMCGGSTDPRDQNTYANEIWLKDAASSSLLTLMLALQRLSANAAGRGRVMGQLQGIIEEALTNGTISADKELTDAQKAYISEATGDERAWQQVGTIGYWLNAWMQSETDQSGRVKYKCVYLLMYSKDDQVRKIEGTHTLI